MGKKPAEVQRRMAFDIYNAIVMRTPVDTGRARGNWNVKTGGVDPSVDEERKTTAPLIKSEDEIQLPVNEQAIYISNNLPYIKALEYGHSKQAPNGMVGVVVANAEAYMQQAVDGVKND